MYQKILVPLDGSELAECVLPHVEAIANGCDVAEVLLVRAVEPFQLRGSEGYVSEDLKKEIDARGEAAAKDYLEQVVNRVKLDGVKVQAEVIVGNAAKSIANYAINNDVDLIVIATHGRSGISRWVMGSVADRLIRSACVPVLMVRAPGCVPSI